VLPDYYKILEVPVTATSAEIKTAYRKLAKLFHPDKNLGSPAAEEKFKQIKDAYENLINPLRRKKYDTLRNRAITGSQPAPFQKKTPARKDYSFSQEEAERRKYYEKHYKTTAYSVPKEKPKKENAISSELKYILISVPLAVALLLLIIRLYEKPKEKEKKINAAEVSALSTSASPYENILGKNLFDQHSTAVIKITNVSGYDAFVFLQDDSSRIVRHHFIEDNFQLYLEKIPASQYKVYSWMGERFDPEILLFTKFKGDFETTASINLIADTIRIKENASDTFFLLLTSDKAMANDTALLKTIFKVKN
jgi:curved DNA-binding protein CbpA